jgi:hypothetical protein
MEKLRTTGRFISRSVRTGSINKSSTFRASDIKRDQPSTDLVADLTWADLYAGKIRQELKTLTPAAKKGSNSGELTTGAAKLRQQLEGAHRTVAELKILSAQPAPPRSK